MTLSPSDLRPAPHVCSYNCWDWSKGSIALVASDGERVVILDYIGGPLDYWVCEIGERSVLDEIEQENGIWIWEGTIKNHRSYDGECDEWLEGEFRPPTDEEWANIIDGESLWGDIGDDWYSCDCYRNEEQEQQETP